MSRRQQKRCRKLSARFSTLAGYDWSCHCAINHSFYSACGGDDGARTRDLCPDRALDTDIKDLRGNVGAHWSLKERSERPSVPQLCPLVLLAQLASSGRGVDVPRSSNCARFLLALKPDASEALLNDSLVLFPRKATRPPIPFDRINRLRHYTAEAYQDGLDGSSTLIWFRRRVAASFIAVSIDPSAPQRVSAHPARWEAGSPSPQDKLLHVRLDIRSCLLRLLDEASQCPFDNPQLSWE